MRSTDIPLIILTRWDEYEVRCPKCEIEPPAPGSVLCTGCQQTCNPPCLEPTDCATCEGKP